MVLTGWGFGKIGRFLAVLALSSSVALSGVAPASANAKFASLAIDARTGAVLSSDAADARRHPASLTKMMTVYIIFQELKAGRLKLSSKLRVSKRAAAMPPSKLGLKPGSTITVEQAIKALIVKSANDVAAAVGENLGKGSEATFAARMTRVARHLGMSKTTFKNASGLPDPAQVTTARDMATLGLRLMRDFPQYYPYFRIRSFYFNGRQIVSHNRLVGRFEGTDGIKTGYTNSSGYNLVTSTRRDGKRVIGVVLGARSAGRRNAYMTVMLSKALLKAKPGNTIAAIVGSSKGAINPIANTKAQESADLDLAEAEVATEPVTKKRKGPSGKKEVEKTVSQADTETLAAFAATASGEEQGDQQPEVIQAELEKKPKKKKSTLPSEEIIAADGIKVASLPPGWSVQVSSFANKKDAEGTIKKLKASIAKELKGKNAYTIAVKADGKLTYRIVFAGLNEKSAKASCDRISKIGKTCAVILPQT